MTGARQIVSLGGRSVWAHRAALSIADRGLLAPATHRVACAWIDGVAAGDRFRFANIEHEILSVTDPWDAAGSAWSARGAGRAASQRRKTMDLLVREVAP
jgi:hypothetical protein